ITLYRAPDHVENERQGALYQNEIIDALAEMWPAESELDAIWKEFRRSYTLRTWPTPNVLCEILRKHRAAQPTVHKPLPPPDPQKPMTPRDRADVRAAMSQIPDGPLKAKLTCMGEMLLERDDAQRISASLASHDPAH
ncbi:MAG: hypothetical protein ACR2OV_00310, partial [Hyphomicrobiaceae bacterium]